MEKFNTEKLNTFPYEDYIFLGLWKNNLLSSYFWMNWLNKEIMNDLGFRVSYHGYLSLGPGYFFAHKIIIRELQEQVLDIFKRGDYEVFRAIKEKSYKFLSGFHQDADRIADLEPTAEVIKDVFEIQRKINTFWGFGFLMGNILDPILLEKAQAEGIDPTEITGLVPVIDSLLLDQQKDARRLSALLRRQNLQDLLGKDRKQLAGIILKQTELKAEFQKHLALYGWIEMFNFIGEPLTLDRLLEQISGLQEKGNDAANMKVLETSSESFKDFLGAVTDASYVRQAGAEYFQIFTYKFRNLLLKVANKLDLEYGDLLNLIPEEIIDGMDGTKTQTQLKQIATNRKNDNWLIYRDIKSDEQIIISDSHDLKVFHKFMVPIAPEGGVLKGQIGNKGKAKGQVKIIMATDDFHKFIAGEILVTTMTTPDFVVLMQKSAAVVTDIGGLLSHAAIVSRELKIPCVIGTKFATQILKDGDMVEVDADKGIVKIIK